MIFVSFYEVKYFSVVLVHTLLKKQKSKKGVVDLVKVCSRTSQSVLRVFRALPTIAVAIPSFHSLNNFQLSFCQEASWKQMATCAPTLFKKRKNILLT